MAHSHVPKFGNWDRENIPYTRYFDNARKEKGGGSKIINPNDPEQNPDAFLYRTLSRETETSQNNSETSKDSKSHRAARAASHLISSDREAHSSKQLKKHQEKGAGYADYMEASTNQSSSHDRVTDPPSRTRKGSKLGSGSDKSSSDLSLLKYHRSRCSTKFTPSPPAQEVPGKITSVPKFGSWDERDPRSGEGFTVIFDKVKEEKKVEAAKLPSVPAGLTVDRISHGNHKNSTSKQKELCCCLFSRGSA